VTQHDVVGRQVMAQIPPGASVSAQSMLVPHLSERPLVYQFPSGVEHADYILLDAASGSFYPFASPADYLSATRTLLASCAFDLLAARDGYLLLRRTGAFPSFTRADNACPRTLPPTFYSFIYAAPPPGATRTAIVFDNEIELVGYTLDPPTVHLDQPELTITTYWRALRPLPAPLTLVVTVRHPDGVSISLEDASAQIWRPAQGWETGAVVKLQSWPIYFDADEKGTVRIGAEVRAGNPADAPGADAVLSVTALAAITGLPPQTPRTINGNTDATLALPRVQ
ncbi:MAG TPA: DUF2079 domain-containing protein, partial [Ktedonobacterales bacterium]|nr:DUF2079 domain-containing protein [Ktedonobacterales bacterium]